MELYVALMIISIWFLEGLRASSGLISFDLQTVTGDTYANFIEELRQEAYHIVELKVSEDVSVQVALNIINLYVVGYCDNYEGKHRAHFFNDAPGNAISDLFKEAKKPLRFTLHYDCRYASILKKAGEKDIRKAGLGIGKWKSSIDIVNNHQIDEKKEANFLLLTIQTISEATRFKYIEQKTIENLEGFTPDYKVPSLESEWRV